MPLSFPFQHVRHFAATSGNLSIANHVSEPKILSRPIRFDYWRTTTFWCSPARSWKIFLKLPIQFAHPQTRSWYLNRVFLQKYSLCNHSVRKCGLIRDQEVGGSNPLAPTNSFKDIQGKAALEDALCDADCDVTLQFLSVELFCYWSYFDRRSLHQPAFQLIQHFTLCRHTDMAVMLHHGAIQMSGQGHDRCV